jgi:phage terminase large subunit
LSALHSPEVKAAAENIRRWREHPQIFVREVFGIQPDAWQDEALIAYPSSPRLALKACAGPGKTAVLAWIGLNFMLTRPHPIVGATSISGANLKANLWTEIARWHAKSPMLQAAFEVTASEVRARDHPRTWKIEARTWSQDADTNQIGNALAGIHGKYVLWLGDECGDYPDSILPIMESIFAGDPVEAHVVLAGNPTRLAGPLYRACTVARNLWKLVEITGDPDDPKRSPRISIEYAREQIQQYGRDNPWVLVRIFGRFPPSSINALIGPDEVRDAMKRRYRETDIESAARILGVDVARFGDDASVIFPRQGLQAFNPLKFRGVDGVQGAGHVARKWQDWDADAAFLDGSGGWATSWVDNLLLLGRAPVSVPFSGEPHDGRYFNKRAEMAFECVEWVKRGGALPEVPELVAAMTQTTYTFKGDKLLLEPKDQVKIKLGYSPDDFDSLMLTFAHPVVREKRGPFAQRLAHQTAYDPLGRDTVRADYAGQHESNYDPLGRGR